MCYISVDLYNERTKQRTVLEVGGHGDPGRGVKAPTNQVKPLCPCAPALSSTGQDVVESIRDRIEGRLPGDDDTELVHLQNLEAGARQRAQVER